MTFIELFAPRGTLTDDQRHTLGERLVTELIAADGAPAEVVERARAQCWLVVHEPMAWTVGARPVVGADAPRYVVRVTVPGGHLNDGMRAEMVARVTRALATVDEDPGAVYREPRAWVHIVELPDGSAGAFGQVMRLADVIRLTVSGTRPPVPSAADDPGPGSVVDPVCGMTVQLTEDAVTLSLDGVTYGFCNPGCRDIFVAGSPA